MTRAFAAAAALSLCAACTHHPAPSATQAPASPPQAAATPPQPMDAGEAYQACLGNAAAEIDNGRGDIAAVTEAVASACHSQYLQLADINETPYDSRAQPGELDAATIAIQSHRKALAAQ